MRHSCIEIPTPKLALLRFAHVRRPGMLQSPSEQAVCIPAVNPGCACITLSVLGAPFGWVCNSGKFVGRKNVLCSGMCPGRDESLAARCGLLQLAILQGVQVDGLMLLQGRCTADRLTVCLDVCLLGREVGRTFVEQHSVAAVWFIQCDATWLRRSSQSLLWPFRNWSAAA